MPIQYLDGIRLYRALTAGTRKVISHQDYLNKINVFPVPDSDTGTNMACTLNTIEEGISSNVQSNVSLMAAAIADTALDGARGNSGAILAQFLVGFSEGIGDHLQLNTGKFSTALKRANQYAYDALADPKEGTILTVIKDWTNAIEILSQHVTDFQDLLASSLEQARIALAETPKKLAVLAKAGVVDAGAQGFVDMLEGIQDFINRGSITSTEKTVVNLPGPIPEAAFEEKYRYCTECIILGEQIDRIHLKEALMDQGNSIVIAGSKTKAKVHIHTDSPKTIMEICSRFGLVSDEKADDMLRQQKDANRTHHDIAIVVDTGCDLSEDLIEKYNIHVVPVRLNFGDSHYVDKVTMTVNEFWNELARNPVHPKTSQPTPGDFRRQYQFLSSHYQSAISIHLPANVSGTFQSAQTAARSVSDFPTTIIDSLNLSIGFGLIAIRAAEAVEAEKSYDEIIAIINQAIKNTTIYIGLQNLDAVVKGGRVANSHKVIADLLHITPVLTYGEKGINPAGVCFGRKNTQRKLQKFVLKRLPVNKPFRIGIANANCEDIARQIEQDFIEMIGPENVFFTDVCPALGVHAGPGGIAIVIQTLEDSLNG